MGGTIIELGILKSFSSTLHTFRKVILCGVLSFLSCTVLWGAVSERAMIVTQDSRATEAALRVLKDGGNAMDAAITAAWVLNVVEPEASGIGGGAFLLYYDAADQKTYVLDGSVTALPGASGSGVPGFLKFLKKAHARFSSQRFSFAELMTPAVRMARQGSTVSASLAKAIERDQAKLRQSKAASAVFFDSSGSPLQAGSLLIQKDLAQTLELLQREDEKVFYEGEIAAEIIPLLTKEQSQALKTFSAYQAEERDPLTSQYRGLRVLTVGPSSQGGSILLEALNILEYFPIEGGNLRSEEIHFISEAQRLALEDHEKLYRNPDTGEIKREILTRKDFAQEKLAEIFLGNGAWVEKDGHAAPKKEPGEHTTHLSIADEKGNLVAMTASLGGSFGGGIMVPGRGFFLNNQFEEAETLSAGKRPRSFAAPFFIFRGNAPVLIGGSPGGMKIPGTLLNLVVDLIDYKMSLEEAVKAPRIIYAGGKMHLEKPLFEDADLKGDLEKIGSKVVLSPEIGNVQAVYFDSPARRIIGASDSRGTGKAEGY